MSVYITKTLSNYTGKLNYGISIASMSITAIITFKNFAHQVFVSERFGKQHDSHPDYAAEFEHVNDMLQIWETLQTLLVCHASASLKPRQTQKLEKVVENSMLGWHQTTKFKQYLDETCAEIMDFIRGQLIGSVLKMTDNQITISEQSYSRVHKLVEKVVNIYGVTPLVRFV